MKIFPYHFILSLFIALTCAGNIKADTPPVKKANSHKADKPGFTKADADLAYKAFNQYFYNPKTRIYCSTTKKDGVAAIWVQAIYWDMAMNVYERTKKPAQMDFIKDIYQGNFEHYDNYNWTNKKVWFIYDDMMWWIMSLARAHQLTGNKVYLEKAIAGFNHVWEGSHDPKDGGMFWDFQHSGKNSCITYPTIIAAVRLYNITGDTSYLNKAKSVYEYGRKNLFDASSGRLADNKIGAHPGYSDYTYNQGTAIGAAYALYKATKDASYLNDAKLAADYTMNHMCKNGILPTEGDFNEQGILKAIFAQYIMELVKDGKQTQYLPWIQQNVNTGWQNRDTARNLTFRNYAIPCPTGDIQSYEGSSIVYFMQIVPPTKK
ncbi:Glycosyl hydrolase family 76 [Mucilaginibacter pineti]|uniref:Glycosyl hydrolase family 76 n=1 Tax=Mucilaginibacter pineti TaxID=1391627 RepID=A0A1G7EYW6_9SPHI|nr:glycoside hydrolase family 76 protein [Mucilaginibacter pineti]SDE68900.1 Glycosyl hydrolase family 76 [Mucilaginibacter pineti]